MKMETVVNYTIDTQRTLSECCFLGIETQNTLGEAYYPNGADFFHYLSEGIAIIYYYQIQMSVSVNIPQQILYLVRIFSLFYIFLNLAMCNLTIEQIIYIS